MNEVAGLSKAAMVCIAASQGTGVSTLVTPRCCPGEPLYVFATDNSGASGGLSKGSA